MNNKMRIILAAVILLAIAPAQVLVHFSDTQHYLAFGMPKLHRLIWEMEQLQPDLLMQVGDLTQNATDGEFKAIKHAFGVFLPTVPWITAPGNHDSTTGRIGGWSQWQKHMGAIHQRYDDPQGRFMALSLPYLIHDDEIEWAWAQMDTRPQTPTILVTHNWIAQGNPAGRVDDKTRKDGVGPNDGNAAFEKLCEPYPQVRLVLCGHRHGEGRRTDTTVLRSRVHQLLSNYQDEPYGGNGFTRVYWLVGQSMHCITWSPTYTGYGTNWSDWFTLDNPFTVPIPKTWRSSTGEDTYVFPFWGGTSTRGWDDMTWCRAGANPIVGLMRFDLTGIPKQITRAALTVTIEGYDAAGDGFDLCRMTRSWSEADSWKSLGGIVVGRDTLLVPDYRSGTRGAQTMTIDVTAAVRSWINGTPNYGWALIGQGSDDSKIRSFNWHAATERPMLTVTF